MATEPELDVDALVEEVRGEAEEARRRVGASRLPPWESDAAVLARDSKAPDGRTVAALELAEGTHRTAIRLAQLAALVDPGAGEIASHRASLGRMVVAAKKVLRRLLTPVLDRQASFNRAAVESLAEHERAVRAELGALSRQILEIEARLDAMSVPATSRDEGFDRRAFEEAFRGSRERVRRAQSRYLEYFREPDAGPILDLGCGRGEFLHLVREAGAVGLGVERDPELARAARADGLDVRDGDVLWALESSADGSLGGVVAFQVVEHLPFWKIVRLVELARAKLRPGGVLILESVNVQSLITWTRAWSLDPTHRQPVHPLTLRFLVERAGFARTELVYAGEVEPELRLEEGEARDARNARRLNDLLFAPQDYAVVARA